MLKIDPYLLQTDYIILHLWIEFLYFVFVFFEKINVPNTFFIVVFIGC